MGEMIKTTRAICKSCKYGMTISMTINGKQIYACDYLSRAKKRRNCEVGECDKYESKRKGKGATQ